MAIEVQSEIAGAAVESRFAGVEGAFLWQLTDILYKKDLVDFQLWSGVKRLVSKFKQTYERPTDSTEVLVLFAAFGHVGYFYLANSNKHTNDLCYTFVFICSLAASQVTAKSCLSATIPICGKSARTKASIKCASCAKAPSGSCEVNCKGAAVRRMVGSCR